MAISNNAAPAMLPTAEQKAKEEEGNVTSNSNSERLLTRRRRLFSSAINLALRNKDGKRCPNN